MSVKLELISTTCTLMVVLIVRLGSIKGVAADIEFTSPRCLNSYYVGESCRFVCSSTLPGVSFSEGRIYENGEQFFPQGSTLVGNQRAFSQLVPEMPWREHPIELQCRANLTTMVEVSSDIYSLQPLIPKGSPSNGRQSATFMAKETLEILPTPSTHNGRVTAATSYSSRNGVTRPPMTSSKIIAGVTSAFGLVSIFVIATVVVSAVCYNHRRKNPIETNIEQHFTTGEVTTFSRQESGSTENELPVFNRSSPRNPTLELVTHKNCYKPPRDCEGSEALNTTMNKQAKAELSQSLAQEVTGRFGKSLPEQPKRNTFRNGQANVNNQDDETINGNSNHASEAINICTADESATPLPALKAEAQTSTLGIHTGESVVGFGSSVH